MTTKYSAPLLEVRLGFPPGTNDVYGYGIRGGKAMSYMRGTGTTYKQHVSCVLKEEWPDFSIPPKVPLYLSLAFTCTSKTLNRRDLDGSTKVLIDALFRIGGSNDVYVRELLLTKGPGPEDAVQVVMREILEGE